MKSLENELAYRILSNQLAIMESIKILLTHTCDPRVDEPVSVTLNKKWLQCCIQKTLDALGGDIDGSNSRTVE